METRAARAASRAGAGTPRPCPDQSKPRTARGRTDRPQTKQPVPAPCLPAPPTPELHRSDRKHRGGKSYEEIGEADIDFLSQFRSTPVKSQPAADTPAPSLTEGLLNSPGLEPEPVKSAGPPTGGFLSNLSSVSTPSKSQDKGAGETAPEDTVQIPAESGRYITTLPDLCDLHTTDYPEHPAIHPAVTARFDDMVWFNHRHSRFDQLKQITLQLGNYLFINGPAYRDATVWSQVEAEVAALARRASPHYNRPTYQNFNSIAAFLRHAMAAHQGKLATTPEPNEVVLRKIFSQFRVELWSVAWTEGARPWFISTWAASMPGSFHHTGPVQAIISQLAPILITITDRVVDRYAKAPSAHDKLALTRTFRSSARYITLDEFFHMDKFLSRHFGWTDLTNRAAFYLKPSRLLNSVEWMTSCATGGKGRTGNDCIVNEDKVRGVFSTQSSFLNLLLSELPAGAWLLRGLGRQEFMGVLTLSINAVHQFLGIYWQDRRTRYSHQNVVTTPSDFILSKVK